MGSLGLRLAEGAEDISEAALPNLQLLRDHGVAFADDLGIDAISDLISVIGIVDGDEESAIAIGVVDTDNELSVHDDIL
jgi:hypothetical protein